MRIPRSATSFLVALEAIAMVVVLVLSVVHPWATKPKNDIGGNNNTQIVDDENRIEGNTENLIGSEMVSETEIDSEVGPEEIEVVFSANVLAKVEAMTLEQKVAQMFIITPETLTGTEKVNVMGNATRNAINECPVGGLVYSAINFQGKAQTMNMLKGVQNHYMTKFSTPVFLMIAEQGGKDTSPLASTNRYTVQAAPSEVGASGDAEKAVSVATNIAKYLKEAGFNTNLAPNVEVYSQDDSVSSIMVAETVSTYREKGIVTVMSEFSSEDISTSEEDVVVYKAGINAGTDCIMLGDAKEETVKYLRANMQYGGVLIADTLAKDQVVPAVQAGIDMLYCPENFKEAYQNVLDAVNAGSISEDDIDKAVARILTCKSDIGNE